MEEKIEDQDISIHQAQDSLLSFKVQKMPIQLPIKALISSMIDKRQSIYTPLQFLQKNFYPKSRSKISKTEYFKLKQSKTNMTKSNKINRNKNNETDQKITYKFLKYCLNYSKGLPTIYQQKVPCIDEINGSGILVLSDGRLMEGTWIDGVPQQKLKIQYPNGLIYYGQVYDYRQHGFGYLYYPDNRRYQGEFCYGQFHGQGVYYDENNQVKRKGEWKHGKYIGQ